MRVLCLAVMVEVVVIAGCTDDDGRLRLRENIGFGLDGVSGLFSLSGPGGPAAAWWGTRRMALAGDLDPGLYAVTESGETAEIRLVQNEDRKIQVSEIHATPHWVFFSTGGLRVVPPGGDEELACDTVALQDDGDLFCAPLMIGSDGSATSDPGPLGSTVVSNAAGDVVHVMTVIPDVNRRALYRITFDEANGPAAVLVDATSNPDFMVSNAAGDVLIGYRPSAMDESVLRTRVLPVGGGAPFDPDGTMTGGAACGLPGEPDENTFYLLDGGHGGGPFTGTIRVLTPDGSSFGETDSTVPPANCTGLFHLADAIYTVCWSAESAVALSRVVVDGSVVAAPESIVLDGVTGMLGAGPAEDQTFAAPGLLVFFAETGASRVFIRYDGVTRTDIPVSSTIDMLGIKVSPSGTIDFYGYDTVAAAKVIGRVEAGSDEATILSTDTINADQVIAFTRVN